MTTVAIEVVPQIGLLSIMRSHIAQEEKLTPEQVARYYSDSKLLAVAQGDPASFAKWRDDALKAASCL